MNKGDDLYNRPKAIFSGLVFLTIFVFGLQYSYYRIFNSKQVLQWDDEGTMMLLFRAFFENPNSYDSIGEWYGPFFYLYKYFIYSILNLDITHDITRLTTIAFWGLIAAVNALFVYRITRSIILAALVQLTLIRHLFPLMWSPGHPQEIALLLTAIALLLTGFLDSGRYRDFSLWGLGVTLGALLLVKINVGVYLAMPLALSLLIFLPRNVLNRGLIWLATVAAVLLPTVVMWRHLFTPSPVRNFCIFVTLAIIACLVMAFSKREDAELQWIDVGVVIGAIFLSMACIFGVIIFWGGSVQGITEAVVFRALDISSVVLIPPNIGPNIIRVSIGAVLIALFYRFVVTKFCSERSVALISSGMKLFYGFSTLLIMYFMTGGTLELANRPTTFISIILVALPITFFWIILVPPYGNTTPTLGNRFPRVFLCLLAAFQFLLAYPVSGAQKFWGVLFIIPLAAICIGDALSGLRAEVKRLWPEKLSWRLPQFYQSAFKLLAISFAIFFFCWYVAIKPVEIANMKRQYLRLHPLGLPGTANIRLLEEDALVYQDLVKSIRLNCDGFVALPGFPSLYFWTQMPPPAIVSDHWILSLEDDRQRAIVEIMENYERPCVIHNQESEDFWNGDHRSDSQGPLVAYIYSQFVEARKFGRFELLVKPARRDSFEELSDDAGGEQNN